jgi:diacylglycerol kinase family enzyme
VFVNNSSIGLYPEIVREREALQRRGHGKWVSLARAMIGVFHHAPGPRLDLRFAHRALKGRTELLFVGNNEYELAAMRIGARMHLDGGVLWVYRVPHAGRFRAIAAALAAFFGGGRPKAPLAFATDELRVDARVRELEVALDGEVARMETPLHYRSRPGALRVMVPARPASET